MADDAPLNPDDFPAGDELAWTLLLHHVRAVEIELSKLRKGVARLRVDKMRRDQRQLDEQHDVSRRDARILRMVGVLGCLSGLLGGLAAIVTALAHP